MIDLVEYNWICMVVVIVQVYNYKKCSFMKSMASGLQLILLL